MLVSLPLSLRFASSKSRERGWNKRTDEIKLEIYVYPYRYIGVDIYIHSQLRNVQKEKRGL